MSGAGQNTGGGGEVLYHVVVDIALHLALMYFGLEPLFHEFLHHIGDAVGIVDASPFAGAEHLHGHEEMASAFNDAAGHVHEAAEHAHELEHIAAPSPHF